MSRRLEWWFIVLLLTAILMRSGSIRPSLAALAALLLALPPAGVAARVADANGGNIEPWLSVVLLWILRTRAWAAGLLLGIGIQHREFTVYGAAALLVIERRAGELWSRARGSRSPARRRGLRGLASRRARRTPRPRSDRYRRRAARHRPAVPLSGTCAR